MTIECLRTTKNNTYFLPDAHFFKICKKNDKKCEHEKKRILFSFGKHQSVWPDDKKAAGTY